MESINHEVAKKYIPKRVANRFNPVLASLNRMLSKYYDFLPFRSVGAKQKYYRELALHQQFFHKEIVKFMVDVYAHAMKAPADTRMSVEILSIRVANFTIFKVGGGVLFGSADKWIEISQMESSEWFVGDHSYIKELCDRIERLIEWRAAFHYVLSQPSAPAKHITKDDIDFPF